MQEVPHLPGTIPLTRNHRASRTILRDSDDFAVLACAVQNIGRVGDRLPRSRVRHDGEGDG
jgi:hypothetical protein